MKIIDFYQHVIGIKPRDLCIDVGANVGHKTEVMLDLGAKVLAIEPDQRARVKLRHKPGDLIVFACAVSDKEGEEDFYPNVRAASISTMSKEWMKGRFKDSAWKEGEKVKTITLASLLSYGVPKFVKIDVEGYEVYVLKGLPLNYAVLPECLCFEFEEQSLDALTQCLTIIKFLYRYGVEFNMSFGESYEMEYGPWTQNEEDILQCFNSHRGTNFFGDVYVRKPNVNK
jgi:FkbM family methyltransferase